MNRYIKQTLSACGRMLLELVMLFPVLFIFAETLMGNTPMLWIFLGELAFAGVFGVITRRFIPSTPVQLIAGLPVCIGLVIVLAKFFGVWPNAYILPIIIIPFVFYRGKQHAQNNWDSILPNYILFAVMVVQCIILALCRLTGAIDPYMTIYYIAGPVSYITAYIVLNRLNLVNLVDEAQSRSSSSSLAIAGGMAVQNRLLLIILLIIGIALSLSTVLYDVAVWIISKTAWLLKWIFKLLFDVDMGMGQGGGGGDDMGIPEDLIPIESGNMDFWGPILEVISYIGVAIVFIALLVLLYKFVKNLIKLITGVIAKLSDQTIEEGSGGALFEDTRESLMDLSQLPKMYAENARERLAGLFHREPGWDDMPTPAEKLKYLYRKVLKKAAASGYNHRTSYTTHEAVDKAAESWPTLAADKANLADTYDAMRYGDHAPDAQALDELHRKLGNL